MQKILKPQTIFIAGISSDIGASLARSWLKKGHKVIGTYRSKQLIEDLFDDSSVSLIECNITNCSNFINLEEFFINSSLQWDLFLGSVGNLEPIGDFFSLDFNKWQESVAINGQNQIGILHKIMPFRRMDTVAKVAFLVGGAINRSFPSYSAYSLGKLCLVKFCELIHDEYPNVHAVSIGTGWVNTKIHLQTINAAEAAGDNLKKTLEFLKQQNSGTSLVDIEECIEWCLQQDRDITGGRNFSVVHDGWRDGGKDLLEFLKSDADKFKLRRHRNNEI